LHDEGETWYYDNEAVQMKRIRSIAEEALKKIETE